MRRLALVALAPVLAAAVLVAAGVVRPGSEAAATAQQKSATAADRPPAGTLVLGGQAGRRAVGLAVRRRPGALEVEAQVLAPDGLGAEGLAVGFVTGAGRVPGTPCGPARYCARLPALLPLELGVRIEGSGGPAVARFELPGKWRPARDLVMEATRVFADLRTVVYDEHLDPGNGEALETRWRIAAPDRLAYRITGGPSAVVVGSRRWDREPGGTWLESAQDRLTLPEPPWTDAITNASLLGEQALHGRKTWVVSFLDDAALPTWFTIWIEQTTGHTLQVRMTTAGHFMRQRYRSFDGPLRIEPPT